MFRVKTVSAFVVHFYCGSSNSCDQMLRERTSARWVFSDVIKSYDLKSPLALLRTDAA